MTRYLRRPRSLEQQVAEAIREMRVAGALHVRNAAPLPTAGNGDGGAVTDVVVANMGGTAETDSWVDWFTCTGGAQDFPLTYLPHLWSWNVSVPGVVFNEDEGHYEVNGQTLSIDASADLRTGEKLRVQYDYLPGVPTTASDEFADLIAALGPLAWYRLDDVSNAGVMTDSSGHAHHGTWNAVTSHSLTDGLIVNDSNQALLMTGTGGEGAHVTSASWMNLTTNLTWVIFFKTTDTSARLFAREQTSGGGQDWSIQFGTGIAFVAGGSVVATSITTGLNDNADHMAAITLGPSGLDIYIDGAHDKNQVYATPLGTSAYDITIGYGGGLTTSHMFAGTLDEAIMFDKVLTAAQIAQIWDAAT